METTTTTTSVFQIDGKQATILLGLAVVAVVTSLLVYLMYRMLLATTRVQPEMGVAMLVAVVVILTIVGFLVLENDKLVTLASVGLGALAGAVSSAWRGERATPDDASEEEEGP